MKKRIAMSLIGVVICAVSVGIFKEAALGVDPFQSLMSGLDKAVPIPFGTLYVIVNAVLLVFGLVFNRKAIGLATFINLFLLGYITEYTLKLLQYLLPAPTLAVRAILLILALILLCFSSSLYMTASLGVSTYDAIAITVSEKWGIGQFKYVRVATDFVCVIIGIGLFLISGGTVDEITGSIGIATILTAFCMGPVISFFNKTVSVPILNGKK